MSYLYENCPIANVLQKAKMRCPIVFKKDCLIKKEVNNCLERRKK